VTCLDLIGTYNGFSDPVYSMDLHNLKSLRVFKPDDNFADFMVSHIESLTYSSHCGFKDTINTEGLKNILKLSRRITKITLESFNKQCLSIVNEQCRGVKTLGLYNPVPCEAGYGLENLIGMNSLDVLVLGVVGCLPKNFKKEFLNVLPKLSTLKKVVIMSHESKDCDYSSFVWSIVMYTSVVIEKLERDSPYFYK